PDVLQLDRAELGADAERRRLGGRLRRADHLAVDLVLDLVAADDDLEGVPLALLDVLVLLVAGDYVELGAAEEQVVVALRAGLEVELDVHVPGELALRLDVQVALHRRVEDDLALAHLEAALV